MPNCSATNIAEQIGMRRHVLHATGHDQVLGAGHDALRGEVHGLLGRPALAVDGGAGHVLGQAGGQPAVRAMSPAWEPMVSRQPITTSSTAPGSMPVRLDQRLEHVGPQVGRVHGGQRPPPRLPTGVRTVSMM